jgi:hypothetical protein
MTTNGLDFADFPLTSARILAWILDKNPCLVFELLRAFGLEFTNFVEILDTRTPRIPKRRFLATFRFVGFRSLFCKTEKHDFWIPHTGKEQTNSSTGLNPNDLTGLDI